MSLSLSWLIPSYPKACLQLFSQAKAQPNNAAAKLSSLHQAGRAQQTEALRLCLGMVMGYGPRAVSGPYSALF
jgi:hypothetical protein